MFRVRARSAPPPPPSRCRRPEASLARSSLDRESPGRSRRSEALEGAAAQGGSISAVHDPGGESPPRELSCSTYRGNRPKKVTEAVENGRAERVRGAQPIEAPPPRPPRTAKQPGDRRVNQGRVERSRAMAPPFETSTAFRCHDASPCEHARHPVATAHAARADRPIAALVAMNAVEVSPTTTTPRRPSSILRGQTAIPPGQPPIVTTSISETWRHARAGFTAER